MRKTRFSLSKSNLSKLKEKIQSQNNVLNEFEFHQEQRQKIAEISDQSSLIQTKIGIKKKYPIKENQFKKSKNKKNQNNIEKEIHLNDYLAQNQQGKKIQKLEKQNNSLSQAFSLSNHNQQKIESSNTIPRSLNIAKKKVSKKQQNQGIRILKQKQTQRIFQHLCNPSGLITVQSLGIMMVRAKKQFQIKDLQNMIDYYETIKRKNNQNRSEQDDKKNKNIQKIDRKVNLLNINSKNKRNIKRKITEEDISQSYSSGDQNYQDQLDQSNASEQEEFQKRQLNFQQFKIIKSYFQK